MSRVSRGIKIVEIHASFPLNVRGIPLPTPYISKIPILSPRTIYLPDDRVAVQGSGLGISSPAAPKKSKDWTLRHVYNSWEQGEGGQREKGKKRRINMGNILKRRRLGTGELRKSWKGWQVPETVCLGRGWRSSLPMLLSCPFAQ